MEIYKLTDNLDGNEDSTGAVLKITNLKQGVKNPERVNVYVNDKFAFALFVAQVVEFAVKVGRVLSEAEFEELKRASEFGKLYQRALEWALVRPRSEREVLDYLHKKIYEKKLDKNYVGEIVEKLKNKKYVSDEQFARWYVENRFVKKGVSAKRLRMELVKKGVAREIIERVLNESGRDDETEILKIIAKKRARYTDEKLMQYLCRQGFPYELVRNLVLTYEKD